jgi:predicted Fe-Mo cluster-binding NifX family protein
MRIAIPVEKQDINSNVCKSFGRTPYILFFNTVTKENYILDNRAVASRGGAGDRVAQVIADHGVGALLVLRCGKNAGEALRKAEVLIYKASPGTAKDNLDAFMGERLALLDEFHDGLRGKED